MYDPNEAYEGDLSYYGLGNQETYSRRDDERFKEPEHVVYVENEDGEDDNDGNKASTTMTRRKGARLPTPKVLLYSLISRLITWVPVMRPRLALKGDPSNCYLEIV